MREIIPGVFHWTVSHPRIGIEVSSYYLADERILIDPHVPEAGLSWFDRGVDHILLTNRHHYRHSARFAGKYACTVWCVESGLHEFTQGEKVKPFRFGAKLPGDIEAVEVGELCADETALLIPRPGRLVALGDGVIREGDGPLAFVPDEFIGDDPEGVKAGLRRSYRRLLNRDFEHLLLAHGHPWVGQGKRALLDFVES